MQLSSIGSTVQVSNTASRNSISAGRGQSNQLSRYEIARQILGLASSHPASSSRAEPAPALTVAPAPVDATGRATAKVVSQAAATFLDGLDGAGRLAKVATAVADVTRQVADDDRIRAAGQLGRSIASVDVPRAGLDAASTAAAPTLGKPIGTGTAAPDILMAIEAAVAASTKPVATGTPRPVSVSDVVPVTRQDGPAKVEVTVPQPAAKPRPAERAEAAPGPAPGQPRPQETGNPLHDHAGPPPAGGDRAAKRPGPEEALRLPDPAPRGPGLGPVPGLVRETTPPLPVGPAAAPVVVAPGLSPAPAGKPATAKVAPDAKLALEPKPAPDAKLGPAAKPDQGLALSPAAKPAPRPEAAPPARIEPPNAVVQPRAGQPAQAPHGAGEKLLPVLQAVIAAVKSYTAHRA